MTKSIKIQVIVFVTVCLAAVLVLAHRNSVAHKALQQEKIYEEICDTFIKEYVKSVHGLKDYILRDDEVDKIIASTDSLAFAFFYQTDLLEYNVYAIDRNKYWEETYNGHRNPEQSE